MVFESDVAAFDPKGILHVVVDPEFEHGRKSRAGGIVKRFSDCKVEDWRLQLEVASFFPVSC